MKLEYPAIGSKWKDLDSRVQRTVEVIRYDHAKPRVRIACIETQRLSWAKPERFNGTSGDTPSSVRVRRISLRGYKADLRVLVFAAAAAAMVCLFIILF